MEVPRLEVPMLEVHIRLELSDSLPVLSISHSIESLLGYTPDDFLNGCTSLQSRIHPDDQDIADWLFAPALHIASGTFNIRLRQANGRIRCVKGQFSKSAGLKNGDVLLDLLLQDARSLPRTLIDASMTANFRSMMENSDDYIYFKDRNHVFTGASQTLVSLCDPAEHWTDLIGQTDYDVFPEAFADIYYRLEKQVFAGFPVAHETQQTLTKDGKKGWVDNRKYPIRDETGEIIGIYGIARNISEQKQVEESLRQKERYQRALLDNFPFAVWLKDTESRFLSVNSGFAKVFGENDADELIGKNDFDIAPHDMAENYRADDRAVMESRQKKSVEEKILTAGTIKWFETYKAPLIDDNGALLGTVGFARDITERKQAEAEQVRLQDQLRESQKMEALGTLAGGVAHDFNNALAAILGNTELARQDVGAGHMALVSLDEIGKAGRRAKDLVQQILAFSRRQKLERKATSLGLVVVESARLIRATLPMGIRLTVDCKADTPAVLADATQTKQILLNLCVNAVQAAQDQGRPGLIEVVLSAHDNSHGAAPDNLPRGRYAHLIVRDNGAGMDEATRAHLFEPFFTTKPKGKGTGLGLAVVHGIVLAHEGQIKVESTPGKGSTFHIYIPALDALVPDATEPTAKVVPIQGNGKHVLYIDDEEAIVFLMKRLLERQGFRVSGYTDQHEALSAARANPGQFDLVVTDYNMPGLSGLHVAEALREIRADLPVIMASGYVTEELRTKAPAAGIRELIYKPNTIDDLFAAVARVAQPVGTNSKSS